MLKMLIADDDKIIRSRLAAKIDWQALGYELVGQAADGRSLLEKTLEIKPDVVLTDIKMPLLDGIEYVQELKKRKLATEVVVITGYAEFEYAQKLLRLGVYDYLLKPIDKEKLCSCMKGLYEKILCRKEARISAGTPEKQDRFEGYEILKGKQDEVKEVFLEQQYDTALRMTEDFQRQMNHYRLSLTQMQQLYMYLFNGIYRGLNEKERADEQIRNEMLTLFEHFTDLEDQGKLLSFSRDLLEKLAKRIGKIAAPKDNLCLQKALEYVDEHFAENLSMAEVANRINVSYGYLSYLLNEYAEGGFVKILRSRRIEEAKKLLTGTELKIGEAARWSGFTSPRYFSEIFSAETGMTPAEYRLRYYDKKKE